MDQGSTDQGSTDQGYINQIRSLLAEILGELSSNNTLSPAQRSALEALLTQISSLCDSYMHGETKSYMHGEAQSGDGP